MGKKKSKVKTSAVVHLFEGDSANICEAIRADVDQVLAGASNGAITPTTANDTPLNLYIMPDKIQFLYIALNQALKKYPNFSPYKSNEIKPTATVGSVRESAYKHCSVVCSHI